MISNTLVPPVMNSRPSEVNKLFSASGMSVTGAVEEQALEVETGLQTLQQIDQSLEIREAFESKKIMYVRNFGDGLGLTWQSVFQTSDRSEVEAYCAGRGIRTDIQRHGKSNDQSDDPDALFRARLFLALAQENAWPIDAIYREPGRLDEVFRQLTSGEAR